MASNGPRSATRLPTELHTECSASAAPHAKSDSSRGLHDSTQTSDRSITLPAKSAALSLARKAHQLGRPLRSGNVPFRPLLSGPASLRPTNASLRQTPSLAALRNTSRRKVVHRQTILRGITGTSDPTLLQHYVRLLAQRPSRPPSRRRFIRCANSTQTTIGSPHQTSVENPFRPPAMRPQMHPIRC